MRDVLARESSTNGASVIADSLYVDSTEAAFANCVLMRATWQDDVVWPAGIHAGVMTLPTALALGEVNRVSGKELLLAIVLGYEVLGALGRVANSWAAPLPRRPTMIFGAFGPVTVGGRLLKFERKSMVNALGYAANLGMGVPEGGQTDHFYGLITRNATCAVQLAAIGGAPYSDVVLEGATGLYRSYFGVVPTGLHGIVDALGSSWEILGSAQKRYPGTSQNTVATDLMLRLVAEHDLTADNVSEVKVFVSFDEDSKERQKELTFAGPFENWMQAYSSLPYAYAIALLDGEISSDRFRDDHVNAPDVMRVIDKIAVVFENGHGQERYCRVVLTTMGGQNLITDSNQAKVRDDLGYALPQNEWSSWLDKHGAHLFKSRQLRELERSIVNLDELDDVSQLMRAARRGS